MDKYFTCEEVAKRYGVKTRTVWSWIREKKLNAVRLGKTVYRIRPEDIKAFDQARLTS